MKHINTLLNSIPLMRKLNVYLVATATVALVAMALPSLLGRANASPPPPPPPPPAQVAEVLQLLADFHGALSYGGDITKMMSLWADDCSLTFNNGTPYVGKGGVQSFFQTGGYFLHNWVSLAPEYKTQIAIHGNTAEATTQCVGSDLNATPMVVKSVIQVNATAVRHGGKWLFTSMVNTTPAPL